ncbi:MAG: glycosyltransferase [Gammaproteobacteria bacterium]|nr:glycosyltransferase [Gammaproteobacteria bacterium]
MRKIAFVLPDARGGGAERVIINLANSLSSDFKVYIFFGSLTGDLLNLVSDKVKVIEMTGATSGLRNVPSIIKYTKYFGVDYLCGTLGMAFAVSIAAPLLRRTTCVARLGNTLSYDIKEKKLIGRFLSTLLFQSLHFSDAIICQSKFMRDDLYEVIFNSKYLENKTRVIYNPVDRKKIRELASERVKEQFDFSFPTIVMVGRIERQKDHISALNAFKLFQRHYPESKFLIIGKGSLSDAIKKYSDQMNLQENVHFLGFKKNPYPYIARSDILLLTSIYEGFSNVLLESFSLATPVVATDSPGGNSELVVDGENGALCKVSDPNDICLGMVAVSDNKEELVSRLKKSKYLESFDVDVIANQYVRCFENVKGKSFRFVWHSNK